MDDVPTYHAVDELEAKIGGRWVPIRVFEARGGALILARIDEPELIDEDEEPRVYEAIRRDLAARRAGAAA